MVVAKFHRLLPKKSVTITNTPHTYCVYYIIREKGPRGCCCARTGKNLRVFSAPPSYLTNLLLSQANVSPDEVSPLRPGPQGQVHPPSGRGGGRRLQIQVPQQVSGESINQVFIRAKLLGATELRHNG